MALSIRTLLKVLLSFLYRAKDMATFVRTSGLLLKADIKMSLVLSESHALIELVAVLVSALHLQTFPIVLGHPVDRFKHSILSTLWAVLVESRSPTVGQVLEALATDQSRLTLLTEFRLDGEGLADETLELRWDLSILINRAHQVLLLLFLCYGKLLL